MEVCFLMFEKAPLSGFVTIVTLGPYSVKESILCDMYKWGNKCIQYSGESCSVNG